MARCEFYRVETSTVRGHTQRADRREPPPKRVVLPWCAQAGFSPVSKAQALAAGAQVLVCGGDLGKCPIADKLA